jgi:hypothetical protein
VAIHFFVGKHNLLRVGHPWVSHGLCQVAVDVAPTLLRACGRFPIGAASEPANALTLAPSTYRAGSPTRAATRECTDTEPSGWPSEAARLQLACGNRRDPCS